MRKRLVRRVKRVVKRALHSQQLVFSLGMVGAVAVFFGLVSAYQMISDSTTSNLHTAELKYSTQSLAAGTTGGSMIPASCDSGVSHGPWDLAGCMSWTVYCTGAPSWQWWQYSDTDPYIGRQYQYIREGDAWCVPPPRGDVPWISSYCFNSGQAMSFDWGAVAADRYAVSFYGLNPGECAAMGWNYDYSSNSCTYWSWPNSWHQITLGNGGMYGLGSMAGRSVSLYVIAGDPWGNWRGTGVSCLPVPTPTPSLSASCTNHNATFWWGTPAYTADFRLRVWDRDYPWTGCGAAGNWCYPETNGGYPGSGHTIGGLYGSKYSWWVHSCNSSGCSPGEWGPDVSCVVPPPLSPPTGLTASCAAGGASVNISWNPVAGASRYLPRIVGLTPAQCAAIGWTWYTVDNATCYTDYHGSTGANIAITPDTNYTFWVHTGDPIGSSNAVAFNCAATPVNPPASISKVCSADGTSVAVTWAPPASGPAPTRYYVNLGGFTPSYCSTIGWTWYTTDNYTCYYHTWNPAWGTTVNLGLVPGNTYNVGVWAGDPVTAGWPGVSTGNFICPVPPPPPTGPSGSCDAAGTTGTFSWSAPSGYNTFYTRVSTVSVGGSTLPPPISDDNFVGTSESFTTVPGTTYYYWVHTKNPSQASPNWSTLISGSFTCPIPTPTPPSNLSASCVLDSNGVGLGTFTWTNSAYATSYNLTANSATFNNVSSGYQLNGFAIGSSPWSLVACGVSGCSTQGSATISCTPPPPTIQFGAVAGVVRSGTPAKLWWTINAAYNLTCTLSGGPLGNQSITHTPPTTTQTQASPYVTPAISNSTNFTMSCTPNIPTSPGLPAVTKTIRVDVVPNLQEI